MKVRMVDPPGGWKYGFPKEYTPKYRQSYADWLAEQGYPKHDIPLAVQHSRWWDADISDSTDSEQGSKQV